MQCDTAISTSVLVVADPMPCISKAAIELFSVSLSIYAKVIRQFDPPSDLSIPAHRAATVKDTLFRNMAVSCTVPTL
jgi:hypothetical protein